MLGSTFETNLTEGMKIFEIVLGFYLEDYSVVYRRKMLLRQLIVRVAG